jgi:hypothetical protein
VMALVPIFIGWFLFRYHLRFQLNRLHGNLSWPFAFPIIIGCVAVFCWVRVSWKRRNSV